MSTRLQVNAPMEHFPTPINVKKYNKLLNQLQLNYNEPAHFVSMATQIYKRNHARLKHQISYK